MIAGSIEAMQFAGPVSSFFQSGFVLLGSKR
jgi:hypothetical protein